MNASPSPKRIRLDSSPPEDDENTKDSDDTEQEHCTICLQSFLDRTIIPVCAHEFCFECILLWSEQSRKCPLCSRSFDDAYLIHRIRSQYDYEKHYLPPVRTSSPPHPLTGESRVHALRHARRERQWGRRQRQQREEADQLERAIARRRWIYQHHLYAKHVASNPYTRYRPFPTPAQFAASPDLISRMTIFLRRELRVWPNLDVEFFTTYTISLMKSIDIRSESAVRLLSEFLDLDTPYAAGARRVHAEHFAHEIYSYLRSPYRDLNMYDQSTQYDTPSEISPPQEIARGNRWFAEHSPSRRSRSRSSSRQPGMSHHEDTAIRPPAVRHGRDDSAAGHHPKDGPNYIHSPCRSPHGQQDHDSRNHLSSRRHSPPDGVQGILLNGRSGSYPDASSSAVPAETQDSNFRVQPRLRGEEKRNIQAVENMVEITAATDAVKSSDPAAALAAHEAGVTRLIDGPPEETGDEVADDVDNVRGGSSANPQPSRKRLAGLSIRVHPRNRTLSESVQAYLTRSAAPRYPPKKPSVSGDEWSTTGTRPTLLLPLTDGPTGPDTGTCTPPCKTAVGKPVDGNLSAFAPNDRQQPDGRRSQASSNSFTNAELANATIRRGGRDQDGDRRHGHDSGGTDVDINTSPVDASALSHDDAVGMGEDPLLGSRSGTSVSNPAQTRVDVSALERQLRARARVRVRLAAIKGGGGAP